jgi:hypothetical protein
MVEYEDLRRAMYPAAMKNVAGLMLILLILLVFRGRPVLVNLLTLDSLSWLKCAPGPVRCP